MFVFHKIKKRDIAECEKYSIWLKNVRIWLREASGLIHAFLFLFFRWNATFMDYSSHVGEVKEYGKDHTLIENVNVDMNI